MLLRLTPQFTENYPDIDGETEKLAQQLREFILNTIPEANEFLYHTHYCYSKTTDGKGRILYLMPERGYVNLGFWFGASLPANDLMEGSGKTMRHIKILDTNMLNTQLAGLITTAWGRV